MYIAGLVFTIDGLPSLALDSSGEFTAAFGRARVFDDCAAAHAELLATVAGLWSAESRRILSHGVVGRVWELPPNSSQTVAVATVEIYALK